MEYILNHKIIGCSENKLIILHGLFGQLENWNYMANNFSNYLETHIVDMRNHGKSFRSKKNKINDLVDDLLIYINNFNIKNAYIIGHSLGGRVGMEFTMKYPEFIKKLIVVDISPKAYPLHHKKIFDLLLSIDMKKIHKRIEISDILSKKIKNKDIVNFLMRGVFFNNIKNHYDFIFNLYSLEKNYKFLINEELSNIKIDIPTLFLKGEHSEYITCDAIDSIQKRFSNYIIKEIKNSSHWIHYENPKDFFTECITFMNL